MNVRTDNNFIDGPEIPEMTLREASIQDIPAMAQHHRMMFEEIWEQKGDHLDTHRACEIQKAYTLKLETELNSGICKAWVIEDDGEIVSSGGITFVSFVPNPYDLSSKIAYLHSIYTEKSRRHRKCAQRIIDSAIQYCSAQVILTASAAGKPVYEKIGFRSTPEMMKLLIKKNT